MIIDHTNIVPGLLLIVTNVGSRHLAQKYPRILINLL